MKVSKLIQLLSSLDGDAEILSVSNFDDDHVLVDDFSHIAPANDENTAFYLYTNGVIDLLD